MPLVLRHFGLEYLGGPLPAENARQGERNPVPRIEGPDGDHCLLVAQYDFRDASTDHPDAALAGSNASDDRDIGKTDFTLDFAAKLFTF